MIYYEFDVETYNKIITSMYYYSKALEKMAQTANPHKRYEIDKTLDLIAHLDNKFWDYYFFEDGDTMTIEFFKSEMAEFATLMIKMALFFQEHLDEEFEKTFTGLKEGVPVAV